MKSVMIRSTEKLPVIKDWNSIAEVCVYTSLTNEMKRFVDEANKNGKTIVGKNKAAMDSLDSHFTGANT